jgi:hypothetical protein
MGFADDWDMWKTRPFPREVPASTDLGFELRSIDSAAAGCLDSFAKCGALDDERTGVLEGCLRDLQKLLPEVPEPARDYFADLAALCRRVLGSAGGRT